MTIPFEVVRSQGLGTNILEVLRTSMRQGACFDPKRTFRRIV